MKSDLLKVYNGYILFFEDSFGNKADLKITDEEAEILLEKLNIKAEVKF